MDVKCNYTMWKKREKNVILSLWFADFFLIKKKNSLLQITITSLHFTL